MAEQVKAKKNVKKQFFEMTAPLTATIIQLYGNSMEEMQGKIVKLDLTRNLRGKNLILKLKVNLEDGKLVGELLSLELAGVYIRRMIRKGTDYVEDSFITECSDNRVVIKPFLITRNKVSREVRKSLRNATKEYLIAYLKSRSMKEIFSEIMTNKLQKGLALRLKKIYPLALCEIRWLELIREERKMVDGSYVVEEKSAKKESAVKNVEKPAEKIAKVEEKEEVEVKKEKKERKKKDSKEAEKEE